MNYVRSWTITLVYDDLAAPGWQWWARIAKEDSEEPVYTTALYGGPGDVLGAINGEMDAIARTFGSQH